MLIDVRPRHARVWDAALEPIMEGTHAKEPFEAWWARNSARLANLHPLVAEQWVYRHWEQSPFCHLPLKRLSCRLESWPTRRILQEVGWSREDWDENPEAGYSLYHGQRLQARPHNGRDGNLE